MTVEQDLAPSTTQATAATLEVVIARRDEPADGIVVLTLAAADGTDLPEWRPGAHVDVTLPGGLTRQYSLSGDPGDRSSWRIAIRLDPQSRGGSAWLHARAAEGTPLTVGAPRNLFALEHARGYVFLAGGVGITPILPMVKEAEKSGIPWTLWYGGATGASMPFLDELAAFGDRVHIVAADTDGLLPLAEILGAPSAGTAVYCCGPEPMITAVEAQCVAWEPGSLHYERFAAAAPNAGAETSFEVHAALSGVDVTVEADQSVLDALLDAGVDAVYSCTQGYCGSCETRVLEGTPDHRDEFLDHSEPVGSMMICVSRACSPRLVLDI